MKTDELAAMLAAGSGPIDRRLVGRRYAVALLGGAAVSALLMLAVLGVRPDLGEAVYRPMFWVKLAFAASMAWGGWRLAERLSRPGARLGRAALGVIAPVLAIWLVAIAALLMAAPAERPELLLGATWRRCPWLIALLSVPVFLSVLWAMRGLAPTRLPLAGAAAGLLAGATATVVYCLHCPEMGAPFVATWYLLGMLLPCLLGLLLGRRVLRW
ncbi:NrsF family protein [Propionivibrio sp.]|jgi:hypothetical protein|uniref:NrsF family protein n=1 Tax=Propionivibrio sp. TaxID=2212460 RepID=UPI0039E2FEA9